MYETIGELGSEQLIPLFREMLLKKRWFSKPVDKETVLCAAAGLSRMRNAAALQLLEEAGRQRSIDRAIIEQAMLAISRGQGSEPAQPEEV